MSKVELKSKKPLIISGPCSAESQEQLMDTCRELKEAGCVDILRAGIWKPRTRPGTFEGHGETALQWFADVKKELDMPISTEVANGKHVESALEYGVDVLWIGARTTVNPFSVQDIADALRGVDIPVLVKNPMNQDIDLWGGAVQRLQAVGIKDVGLIHRGFTAASSKYRNPPMWHLALEMRRKIGEDIPMICDPSHICGNREFLHEVSQKSADLRYDGLIVESHINPCDAWSDASQQLTPKKLAELVRSIVWRPDAVDSAEYLQALEQLRGQIDSLDAELWELMGKRMSVADKIGEVKKQNNVAILQTNRWEEILQSTKEQAEKLQLSESFVNKILNAIHVESINRQDEIMNR